MIIWQKAGVSGKRSVRLCQTKLPELGLNEASARRGIARLEAEGLITVQRRPGRGLEVTLNDIRDVEDAVDLSVDSEPPVTPRLG